MDNIIDAFDLSDEHDEELENEKKEEEKKEKEVTIEDLGELQKNSNGAAWDIYYICNQINGFKYQLDCITDGQQVQSILQQMNALTEQLNEKTAKLEELNNLFINSNIDLNDEINLAEYIDFALDE